MDLIDLFTDWISVDQNFENELHLTEIPMGFSHIKFVVVVVVIKTEHSN